MRAAVGLGSNLGDRARYIADAVGALSEHGSLVRVSSVYETAPIGGPEQDSYLNAVVVLDTKLTARQLLDVCLDIEHRFGRERQVQWGPRTIDLDLLLYGSESIVERGLTVPHPRLTERRFVLEPLLEVWPNAALPDGRHLTEFVAAVAGQEVRRFEAVSADRMSALVLFLIVGLGAVAIWWLGDWLL